MIIAIYLLFPSMIFFLLGQYFYTPRPMTNVDYILIGIMVPYLNRISSVFVLTISLWIDFIYSFAPTFYFSPTNALVELFNLAVIQWFMGLVIIACFLLSVVLSFAWIKLDMWIGNNRPRTLVLVLTLIGLLSIDYFNGTNSYSYNLIQPTIETNIATSAIYKTAVDCWSKNITYDSKPPQKTLAAERATNRIASLISDHNNIVLVIVESWGLFKSDNFNLEMMRPFFSEEVRAGYHIYRGSVPAKGSTIGAEFRELCGLWNDNPNISNKYTDRCLPNTAKASGYKTIAIHGFDARFYSRYRWYPLVGFENLNFANDLKTLGIRTDCGITFRGACDLDVICLIDNILRDSDHDKPVFVYWLTLNGHYPVIYDSDSRPGSDQLNDYWLPYDKPLRAWAHTTYSIISSLSSLAIKHNSNPTHFIIVGDHNPTFPQNNQRELFAANRVPYVELIPRR